MTLIPDHLIQQYAIWGSTYSYMTIRLKILMTQSQFIIFNTSPQVFISLFIHSLFHKLPT